MPALVLFEGLLDATLWLVRRDLIRYKLIENIAWHSVTASTELFAVEEAGVTHDRIYCFALPLGFVQIVRRTFMPFFRAVPAGGSCDLTVKTSPSCSAIGPASKMILLAS